MAAADLLGAVLGEQLDTGHCFARLDLSEVTVPDCSALGVLLHAHDRFLAAHGTLLFTGVGTRIARLIALTGLDGVLFTTAGATTDLPPGELASIELAKLADRAVIDQALGIIISRGTCTLGEAVDRLQMLSERTNRNLREVAQSILDKAARRAGQQARTTQSPEAGIGDLDEVISPSPRWPAIQTERADAPPATAVPETARRESAPLGVARP